MGRKPKEQNEVLKKTILDYLQENGLLLRQQYGVADAKFADDPARLLLVMTFGELSPDTFKDLTFNGIKIPVEIQQAEDKPIIITGNVAAGEGTIEPEDKTKEDNVFHHEFSPKAAKNLSIQETVGPHVSAEDVQSKEKEEAYEAWKKRNKGVKIIGD